MNENKAREEFKKMYQTYVEEYVGGEALDYIEWLENTLHHERLCRAAILTLALNLQDQVEGLTAKLDNIEAAHITETVRLKEAHQNRYSALADENIKLLDALRERDAVLSLLRIHRKGSNG